MRRPELDYVLSTMLDSQPDVSDLLFTVDKPLQVESFGELKPVGSRHLGHESEVDEHGAAVGGQVQVALMHVAMDEPFDEDHLEQGP